jgi:hypothetical protein
LNPLFCPSPLVELLPPPQRPPLLPLIALNCHSLITLLYPVTQTQPHDPYTTDTETRRLGLTVTSPPRRQVTLLRLPYPTFLAPNFPRLNTFSFNLQPSQTLHSSRVSLCLPPLSAHTNIPHCLWRVAVLPLKRRLRPSRPADTDRFCARSTRTCCPLALGLIQYTQSPWGCVLVPKTLGMWNRRREVK